MYEPIDLHELYNDLNELRVQLQECRVENLLEMHYQRLRATHLLDTGGKPENKGAALAEAIVKLEAWVARLYKPSHDQDRAVFLVTVTNHEGTMLLREAFSSAEAADVFLYAYVSVWWPLLIADRQKPLDLRQAWRLFFSDPKTGQLCDVERFAVDNPDMPKGFPSEVTDADE